MTVFQLEESKRAHPSARPETETGLKAMSLVAPQSQRDQISDIQEEIDDYLKIIVAFGETELSEVLQQIAGISARLSTIRIQLQRLGSQRANRLRTTEIDPLINALEFQFKIFSRIITERQREFDLTRGQT